MEIPDRSDFQFNKQTPIKKKAQYVLGMSTNSLQQKPTSTQYIDSASNQIAPTKVFDESSKSSQEYNHEGSDVLLSPYKDEDINLGNFSYEENFRVILEGELEKKTLNSTYQTRHFVLTPIRLLYYVSSQKRQLKGCFNFVSLLPYGISLECCETYEIKLKLNPKKHAEQFKNRYIIQLQFQDKQSTKLWYCQLDKVIKKLQLKNYLSSPFHTKITELYPSIREECLLEMNSFNSNFWNYLYISEDELFSYCNHLDILLMRSKNPVSYFSRFFMRSYYDHVAVVFKSELNQIFILEATESTGVSHKELDSFLEFSQDLYEEIAYRRLTYKGEGTQNQNFNNSDIIKGLKVQELESYLNSLIGKKYELSLKKLLMSEESLSQFPQSMNLSTSPRKQKKQKSKEQSGQKENVSTEKQISSQKSIQNIKHGSKEKQTFFCSELIAEIYLKFGVLTQGKSKDYWPKDFEENSMKLKSGYSLSTVMRLCQHK